MQTKRKEKENSLRMYVNKMAKYVNLSEGNKNSIALFFQPCSFLNFPVCTWQGWGGVGGALEKRERQDLLEMPSLWNWEKTQLTNQVAKCRARLRD